MKKRIIALAAAFTVLFSCTGCGEVNSPSDNSGDVSDSISDNIPSNTDGSSGDSDPDSGSSDSNEITTDPLIVKCSDIITENDKRTFDVETTCGNAFVVIYHYISSDNNRIENAIASFKPLGVTELDKILSDPIVGGGDLSESDFDLINGVYTMKEDKAKTLLGTLASTYSFDQFWKNQKMAELVSTEGISAEEARPKVEEMFENMGKDTI